MQNLEMTYNEMQCNHETLWTRRARTRWSHFHRYDTMTFDNISAMAAKKWTKKCATSVGAGFSSVLNLYSACNSSLLLFSLCTSFPESLMFTLQDFVTRRRSLYCVGSFRFHLKTRARTTVPVLTWTSWKVGARGGWKANCAQRKRAGPKRKRFSRLMRKLIREAFNSESPATFFLSR